MSHVEQPATSPRLVPPPPNDFLPFMRTYYQRCREAVPQIRAVAAKWAFEDLIPGLSDFDVRFIVADGMGVEDWRRMSSHVGRVHTELCREQPHWARNLEHLPGINLTVSEICDARLFYPEFQQWTFYAGDPDVIGQAEAALSKVPWSARDEIHHLKKIRIFYGPYNRSIDPPVNVGAWSDEYALHSRLLHYFAPPLQSMVSILLRRNVRGKLEAVRLARELLPNPETIDRFFDILQSHYELCEYYREPQLTDLERDLENYLRRSWGALAGHTTQVSPHPDDSPEDLQRKLSNLKQDPIAEFFESAKFARLLKGRLLFYADSIEHFDSEWLIRIELGRIVSNFYTKPMTIFALAKSGQRLSPEQVLDTLQGKLLSEAECEGMRRFQELASKPILEGSERAQARAVAEVYDVVLTVIERLSCDLLGDG